MKYRGDEKASWFNKGKKEFLLDVRYFAGMPVKPNHNYTQVNDYELRMTN